MKSLSFPKSRLLETGDDIKLLYIRFVVGLIFISEGVQKYLFLEVLGPAFFHEIGFKHAFFWAYFTGAFEIACGLLLLAGLFTRIATVPLFIVMITAFFTTKLPILTTKGFWEFAHDYDIDFVLTVLIVLLFMFGGGKWSADSRLFRSSDT
jgi:putative oxidoreductase